MPYRLLGNMGSLPVLLDFNAANRLGGAADGAGVVAVQVDGHGVCDDVDGDDLVAFGAL